MGQEWDSFESLVHYQDWVARWAQDLIGHAMHDGAVGLFFGGTRTWHHTGMGLERGGFEIIDTIMWLHGQGFPKAHKTEPGYYTALKPAWEPIFICRAPRGSMTLKAVMEESGSGSLNIHGSRVGEDYGRWPANFIISHHDDCVPLGDELLIEGRSINRWKDGMKPFGGGAGHEYETEQLPPEVVERYACVEECPHRYLGAHARYFYCPKASKSEKDRGLENVFWMRTGKGWRSVHVEEYLKLGEKDRAAGNPHPTVKPLTLCRYLAGLILPPQKDGRKRRILVPFSGSGSEMIGAVQAGFDEVIGVEMMSDYTEIAEKRLAAQVGMF